MTLSSNLRQALSGEITAKLISSPPPVAAVGIIGQVAGPVFFTVILQEKATGERIERSDNSRG